MKLFKIKLKQDGEWVYVAAPNLAELVSAYINAIAIEVVSDKVIICRERQ